MHNGAVFVSRKRPLLNSGTTGYEPKPLKQGPLLGNGTDKGIRKWRTSRKARFCRRRRTGGGGPGDHRAGNGALCWRQKASEEDGGGGEAA